MPKLPSIAVPVTRRSTTKKARPAALAPLPDSELAAAALERRQPRPQSPVPQHRFEVGQRLRIVNVGSAIARASGICRVISLVPNERGGFTYRVRNESENFERIVAEADLAPLDSQLP